MIEENLKHRIEQLSDIELKLLAVKAKDLLKNRDDVTSPDRHKRIVAYMEGNGFMDTDALKIYLRDELPDYMVPASIFEIEKIPLLPNGKIDKKELIKINQHNSKKVTSEIEIVVPKTEIEEKLSKIWEEVLDFSPISTQDNFFEIGGDSILSVQIIAKARKIGMMITPNLLFEYQTIAELAKKVKIGEQKVEEHKFLTTLRKKGSKKPLFCIHSGGGHVFFYGLLKKYLKSDRPIYAVQPSGLYKTEAMHKSIEEMTLDYLKAIREVQPHGPYNILVYCFSASVGQEMSIVMEKQNEKLNVIVVDTMASPWNATAKDTMRARVASFVTRMFLSPIRTIKTFFTYRKYMLDALLIPLFGKDHEKELERLKANLRQISLDYKWKEHNGNVSLILAEKPDKTFQKYVVDSWKKYALGGVKVYPTKGNHTLLFEDPYIENVSKIMDECLID